MLAIALGLSVPEILQTQLSKRALNRALKKATQAAGEIHHQKIIPDHFEPNAKYTHDYTPRTKGYSIAKANSGHGTADLVWSGASRDAFLSFATVAAYPTRYTVTMQGPNYFTMQPNPQGKRPSAVNKFNDLQTVNAAELKLLESTYKAALEEALQYELDGNARSAAEKSALRATKRTNRITQQIAKRANRINERNNERAFKQSLKQDKHRAQSSRRWAKANATRAKIQQRINRNLGK
jgi:hypothetical protein